VVLIVIVVLVRAIGPEGASGDGTVGNFGALPAGAIEAFGFDAGGFGMAKVGTMGDGGVEGGFGGDVAEAFGLLIGHRI
jgi:hypothetical protein